MTEKTSVDSSSDEERDALRHPAYSTFCHLKTITSVRKVVKQNNIAPPLTITKPDRS